MGKFEKTLFDSVKSSITEQELVEIVREEPRIKRFQEYSATKLLFKNIVVAPHSRDRVAVKVEIRASTSAT
ncbi:MAG: hypothetical protein ACXADC_17580 [Candidatus Thorarchaeota archaeon]|jgi:hypothetical protein